MRALIDTTAQNCFKTMKNDEKDMIAKFTLWS